MLTSLQNFFKVKIAKEEKLSIISGKYMGHKKLLGSSKMKFGCELILYFVIVQRIVKKPIINNKQSWIQIFGIFWVLSTHLFCLLVNGAVAARLGAPKQFDMSYLSPTMAANLMSNSEKVYFGDSRFSNVMKIILHIICQSAYLADFILVPPLQES